jgi:non-specific protein-tyrosine kinase
MKLRQALEKAKKLREEASPSPAAVFTAPAPAPSDAPEAARPPGAWKSPVYSESNRVDLDEPALVRKHCVCIQPDSKELEFYKVLRTKIQFLTRHKGLNTVMITSAREAEGKTLTCINLAMTFAKAFNQTVMLVDGDLRRQSIHRVLGYQSEAGLADYLLQERPLKDIVVWPGIEQMTLISGGRTVSNSAELLSSPRMKALAQEMKTRYEDRYVLFDSAPVLSGADAMALAAHVDSLVMVVEEGRTSLRDVKKALSMLPAEKLLGFVLNRQRKPITRGYKYYG